MIPSDTTHLAFVAGFLEGDGSFSGMVSAAQKDPEVLERLAQLCGGRVTPYTAKSGQVYYTWRLSGLEGYELAEALYPFMTNRRKRQIDKLLAKRASLSYNVRKDQCPSGHQDFGQRANGSRYCKECSRQRHRNNRMK